MRFGEKLQQVSTNGAIHVSHNSMPHFDCSYSLIFSAHHSVRLLCHNACWNMYIEDPSRVALLACIRALNALSRSGVESIDSVDMISDHAVPVALVVEHSVAILGSLASSARKSVAILPEEIGSNSGGVESSLLPRVLDGAVVLTAVFFHQAWLASSCAGITVSRHPKASPLIRLAP